MEVCSRDIHVIESDSDKSDTQSTDSQMDDLVVNNPPAKNTKKPIRLFRKVKLNNEEYSIRDIQ